MAWNMENDNAVFKATVNGLKTIPSRKVVQITIECPIEELPRVALIAQHGDWLAVARLCNESGEQQKEPQAVPGASSQDWDDMTPAEQSGVLCRDPVFWRYLRECQKMVVNSEIEAASIVRNTCNVESRAHIIRGSNSWLRWNALVQRYRTWQLAPRLVG